MPSHSFIQSVHVVNISDPIHGTVKNSYIVWIFMLYFDSVIITIYKKDREVFMYVRCVISLNLKGAYFQFYMHKNFIRGRKM